MDGSPTAQGCGVDAAVDAPIHHFDGPFEEFDAADFQPPFVVATDPVNGATGVPADNTIMVQFSEPVLNVNLSSFLVRIGLSPVAGTLSATSLNVYDFTPSASWPAASTVQVELTQDIHDYSGNAMSAPYDFGFTTAP